MDLYEAQREADWYRFTLDDGQSATLALATAGLGDTRLELYDSSVNLLAIGAAATNVSQVLNNFVDTTSDGLPAAYSVRVTGDPAEYSLLLVKDADFDTELSGGPGHQAQDISLTGVVLAALSAGGPGEDIDQYSVRANTGDVLTASTLLPAAGPGQFVNELDVAVELYDPGGLLVAADPGGSLAHTAAATGAYTVRVLAENDTAGEYVLSVTGYSGAAAPFEVTATDPADGARFLVAPAVIRVDLSDQVLLASVEASDLTVDGVAATAVALLDGDTLEFTLPALVAGVHQVSIGAGALVGIQGQPIEAFAGELVVDVVAPRLTDASIQEGDLVPAGVPLVVTVRFDEELSAAQLDPGDVQLAGQNSGPHTATALAYEPATSTLSVEFGPLPEDQYTLTLVSGDGAFQDLAGNDLDGEPLAFPIPPNTSGDGQPGGDFVVNFTAEISTAPYPTLLAAKLPAGSLIYDPSVEGIIGVAGDVDRFTLDVDVGQTITVVVQGDNTLQAVVELSDPSGTEIGTAMAASTGAEAVLQAVGTTGAGTYTVAVRGQDGTTGSYTAAVVLNAEVEDEQHGGPANDHLATAQDIDASFIPLGFGTAQRGAVLGSLSLYLREDFESGGLDSQWTTSSSQPEGRIQVTGEFGTAAGGYALLMDRSNFADYNLNEAIWTVDLSGQTEATLRFFHAEFDDEEELLPADFVGSANGDGVAISDDGVNWHTVINATAVPIDAWRKVTVDLAAKATAAGMTLGAGFQIKFQQYDNADLPRDGRGYDEVAITTLGPTTGDWYHFTLADGQSATVAATALSADNVTVDLYDASGQRLATAAGAGSMGTVIRNFVDTTSDGLPASYFVEVVGFDDYSLVVTRDADFDTEPSGGPGQEVQDIGSTGVVLGALSAGPSGEEIDEYCVRANAGDILTASTLLPAAGPGQFVNDLNVALDTLILFSRDGALEDLVGNDLDGEPVAFPIPPERSGNGVPGGDFVVHFTSDMVAAAYPVPLDAIFPAGSLVYDGSVDGVIGSSGDTDSFTIDLDDGQTITVVVETESSLQAAVNLSDPDGAQLGAAAAAATGGSAVIQTAATTGPGTYTVTVSGAVGTTGAYSVRLILGAAVEDEYQGGSANDLITSAQELGASFVPLGGTGAERGAVLGTLDPPDVTNLGPNVNTADAERNPAFSADGLTLLLNSNRPGGAGGHDLYAATRASTSEPYANVTSLGADVNTADNELAPTLSTDGLVLVFASNRTEGFGGSDLYMATRSDTAEPFGNVTTIGPGVNTDSNETNPSISADGLSLYFNSNRPGGFGGHDIYVATRSDTSQPFADVLNLGSAINATSTDTSPSISADGRTLFFQSNRPGGFGGADLYFSVRADASAPFSAVNLARRVSSRRDDRAPSISFDGRALVFDSERSRGEGSADLYQALAADVDWYQFTLADGQSATMAVTSLGPENVTLELYDSGSNLLARGVPATNVNQVINNFADSTSDGLADAYFVRIAGDASMFDSGSGQYSLVVTKDADFDTEPNDDVAQEIQDISPSGVVLGSQGDGSDSGDAYRFEASAGDTLLVQAQVPAAGSGQFVNDLDPALELYDPDGSLVASGADGPLTYAATVTGSYAVRVLAENGTSGEYVLRVAAAAKGDMNLDGTADLDDIDGLVLALRAPAQYEALYGLPPSFLADTDGDGDLDFDDIPGFVDLLRPGASALHAANGSSDVIGVENDPVDVKLSTETRRETSNVSNLPRPKLLPILKERASPSRFRSASATVSRELGDDELATVWSGDFDWLHSVDRDRFD